MTNEGVPQIAPQKTKTSMRKKAFIGFVTILFLGAIAAAVYFFLQYNAVKSNPDSVATEKTQALTQKISKIYTLPDETPTVAEIKDKEKLKEQPFFDKAENGDYLLIFPNAKQAVIYRDSINKLINVGPVSIADENAKTEKK